MFRPCTMYGFTCAVIHLGFPNILNSHVSTQTPGYSRNRRTLKLIFHFRKVIYLVCERHLIHKGQLLIGETKVLETCTVGR